MILSVRNYQHSDFRGFNFMLSSLSPQVVDRQSAAANTSFQEALLAVHGNSEATLPFPSFDQESCELKVAKFRAEKKIRDRLLPPPRYYCVCFFQKIHAVYVNIPSWMKVYLLKSSGELTNTESRETKGGSPEEEWLTIAMSREVVGLAVSIFEDPEFGVEDWSRCQKLPQNGSLLRVSQFIERPRLGEPGRNYMPLWTLNLT